MQVENWLMIAKSRHKLYFTDSVNQPSFLKQQYKQLMPKPLQSDPSVCSFYTIYEAFHLFEFRQEENTVVHYVNVYL